MELDQEMEKPRHELVSIWDVGTSRLRISLLYHHADCSRKFIRSLKTKFAFDLTSFHYLLDILIFILKMILACSLTSHYHGSPLSWFEAYGIAWMRTASLHCQSVMPRPKMLKGKVMLGKQDQALVCGSQRCYRVGAILRQLDSCFLVEDTQWIGDSS